MRYLATSIHLPPGIPSVSVIRELLHRIFETYQWFRPVKYGRAILNGRLDPAQIDFDALVAYYERYSNITVTARTDRDFLIIFPAKPDVPAYVGRLTWMTSAQEGRKPRWREAHLRQVKEIMTLLSSPLALAGVAEDFDSKEWRVVTDPGGRSATRTFTVRDYSEGLAGLFWRNFLGPPFVQLFGERLDSLSGEFKQDLGDGITLVQPYGLPSQAGTPEGVALEQQLIAHLGPECFYDHQRHLKPSRVPDLSSL